MTRTCRHEHIIRHRDERYDISLWSCADCRVRFYPACEKCVTIGHREGHGEHVESQHRGIDDEDPVLTWLTKQRESWNGYAEASVLESLIAARKRGTR